MKEKKLVSLRDQRHPKPPQIVDTFFLKMRPMTIVDLKGQKVVMVPRKPCYSQ